MTGSSCPGILCITSHRLSSDYFCAELHIITKAYSHIITWKHHKSNFQHYVQCLVLLIFLACRATVYIHTRSQFWPLFPYTRRQEPGRFCALHYISVWQAKKSTIVLSHGGHRAFSLEKYYLYLKSEWFTMCSIWNPAHVPHSEFPYHYNFSFHMLQHMLTNELISVGSCTWLPPGDPQCSVLRVGNRQCCQ